MRAYIELNQEEQEFWEMYNSLSEENQKMVRIVCTIGASNILTSEEFHLLLQSLRMAAIATVFCVRIKSLLRRLLPTGPDSFANINFSHLAAGT